MATAKIVLTIGTATSSGSSYTVPVSLYYYGNGVSHSGYTRPWTISDGSTTNSGSATFTTSTSAQLLGSTSFTWTKASSATTKTLTATFSTGVSIGTLSTTASVTVPSETITVTIKYYANGGTSGSMANTTYTVASSGTINLRTNTFARTGYRFLGWSLSSSASTATYSDGQAWSRKNNPTGQVYNLYAIWTPHTRTYAFNGNGATSGSMSNQTITYASSGSTSLTANAFSRIGYTFKRWNTASNDSGTAFANQNAIQRNGITSTSTVTLYAIWNIKTYTISYNTMGGETSPSSQTKEYNNSITLSMDIPTKMNYTFVCWNTSSDGTGTNYFPGQSYSQNENLQLYAIWTLTRSLPQISNIVSKRCDEYGNETADGIYCLLGFDYVFDTEKPGENQRYFIRYKTTSESSQSYHDLTVEAIQIDTTTLEKKVLVNSFDINSNINFSPLNNYDIQIIVTETYSPDSEAGSTAEDFSTTITTFISKSFFIMDFGSEGYGIGIGQAANPLASSLSPRLDIGIPIYANSYINLGNWSAGSGLRGTDSDGNYIPIAAVSISNNVVIGNSSSSNTANATNIYGHLVRVYADPTASNLNSARTLFNTDGTVTLAAAPTANMHAATKQYVDTRGASPSNVTVGDSNGSTWTATGSGIVTIVGRAYATGGYVFVHDETANTYVLMIQKTTSSYYGSASFWATKGHVYTTTLSNWNTSTRIFYKIFD